MRKRIISVMLVIVMVFAICVPSVFADASFSDVAPGAWYEEAVLWAVENGVTAGMGNGKFAPNNTCTRGQVVTFLWRSQGEPEPQNKNNPFADVKESDYFYDAVLWAVEKGVTNGLSATSFGPNASCTRAQVVTFLWRAMGKPAPQNPNNPFGDIAGNAYYFEAVLWAVENGITAGMGDGVFAPDNACNRGQIVCFLYRTPTSDKDPEPTPPTPTPPPATTYTVMFMDYDGTVLKTETVEEGQAATAPSAPARDGYKFVGWDKMFDNISSNIVVSAIYEEIKPIVYTVMFIDHDGTTLKTETVEEGKSATAPANPTRDGYKFTGWNKSFDNVKSDLVVTAVYEEVKAEAGLNAEQIYSKCASAVFYIEIYNRSGQAVSSGSGVFISSDGKAITNHHVVDDAYSAKVMTTDGNTYNVTGYYDALEDIDMAMIQVDGNNFSYLSIGDSTAIVGGQNVFAIGSPLGLDNTISTGIISNPNRVLDGLGYIQITAPISHGSSGGALINDRGFLIGITSAGFDDGQNLNLAVPIHHYKELSDDSLHSFPIGNTPPEHSDAYVNFETPISVTVGETATLPISAWPGDYDDDVYINYSIGNEDIVSAEWDDWDEWDINLYVSGESVGSTTITISLYTDIADELLAYSTLEVTVSAPTINDPELAFNVLRDWIIANANSTLGDEILYSEKHNSGDAMYECALLWNAEYNVIDIAVWRTGDKSRSSVYINLDPYYDTTLAAVYYYQKSGGTSTLTFEGSAEIYKPSFTENSDVSFYEYDGDTKNLDAYEEFLRLTVSMGLSFADGVFDKYIPGYSIADFGFVSF